MTATPERVAAPGREAASAARAAAQRLASYLAKDEDVEELVNVRFADEPDELAIPRSSLELLGRALALLGNGDDVVVLPHRQELTTQQAAGLLNVSRPFLIGLLESGDLPYRKVGSHRRIAASALIDYQRRDDAARQAAADELSAEARELGLT
jgi:excisionase family DNA binding protein